MEERKMPSKGLYIFFIILGFLCGLIWGIVGVTQYSPMSTAIDAGDYDTAWAKAKVIKIVTFVGLALNIVVGVYLGLSGQTLG